MTNRRCRKTGALIPGVGRVMTDRTMNARGAAWMTDGASGEAACPAPSPTADGAAVHFGMVQVAGRTGRLTNLQRRIGNLLLQRAYDGLLLHEAHTLRLAELAECAGVGVHEQDAIRAALRQLRSIAIEWSIPGADGRERWGISSMLAEVQVDGDDIVYSYPPILRALLCNPEFFAKIDLRVQKRFSSNYALNLYESCQPFRAAGSTGFLPVEAWKRLIGVEEGGAYAEFKNLNRKIIKPSLEEINAVSGDRFSVRYRKEGRRVVALCFDIYENDSRCTELSEGGSAIGAVLDEKNESGATPPSPCEQENTGAAGGLL